MIISFPIHNLLNYHLCLLSRDFVKAYIIYFPTHNMVSITCNCGYKVEDKDHYKVEAMAWHHAIKDHPGMLKMMTVKQIEEIIRMNDKNMGI